MLKNMGITLYQGYYFSKPVPVDAFIQMLPRSFSESGRRVKATVLPYQNTGN
jgi:sensor c-di-GMP phosphodiesterase-like protein